MKDSRLVALLWAIPVLVGFAAHEPAAHNGFTNWDDPDYLLANPIARDPLAEGWGRLLATGDLGYPVPVVMVAYSAQAGDGELDAQVFHLTSIVLHLLVAVLAAWLARALGAGALAAAGAAAVFAAHPLTVEPVAWVVGQKDLLAALFALAALNLRARRDGVAATIAVGVLAALAIGAKPSAVAVAPLVIGVDLALGRGVRGRRALALYAGVGAVALASIALAMAGHSDDGAVSPMQRFGLRSLAEVGWAFALQVRHALVPYPLGARYFEPSGWQLAVWSAAGWATLAGAMWLTGRAWRRGARAVAFGVGGALVAYLPASGLLPLDRGPADSYAYLPLALLVIAAARGLDAVLRWRAPVAAVLVAAIAVPSALGSRSQAQRWRGPLAVWSRVAEMHPGEPRARQRLGDAFMAERDYLAAADVYEDVSARYPGFAEHLLGLGDAYYLMGRPERAELVYADAVRRQRTDFAREHYALFLAGNEVAPSDHAVAEEALVHTAPLLIARGKRPTTLRRAAALLEGYGHAELAAKLRARADAKSD